MECIGCKSFHEAKDIKAGEERKCFICNRELEKKESMKQEQVIEYLEIIKNMPDEEVKYVSKNPDNTMIDIELYKRCLNSGDMTQWEKLKKIRKMFNN